MKMICGHTKMEEALIAMTVEMIVKSKQGNNGEQVQKNKQEIEMCEP